jgi:hypothetical protein
MEEESMAQTFNPALHDKHAEDLGEVLAADRHAKLDTGLEDSFPPPIRQRHAADTIEGRRGCRASLAVGQGQVDLQLGAAGFR